MKVVHSSLFRAVCTSSLVFYSSNTANRQSHGLPSLSVCCFSFQEPSPSSPTSALRELQRRCKARCFLTPTANRLSESLQLPYRWFGQSDSRHDSGIDAKCIHRMADVYPSAILILGAITQMANLVNSAKMGRVGIIYWLMPSALLLLGILAVI